MQDSAPGFRKCCFGKLMYSNNTTDIIIIIITTTTIMMIMITVIIVKILNTDFIALTNGTNKCFSSAKFTVRLTLLS